MRAALLLPALGLVFVALPGSARTIKVKPGQSIQDAVNTANSGDTVSVAPGTYHEAGTPCPTNASQLCAVVVTKDNIKLVGRRTGAKEVILENPGGQDQGIAIAKSGAEGQACLTDTSQRINSAFVSGFTVNGFDGAGVLLFCVDNWTVQKCTANDNNDYGVLASHCGAGRVKNNVATGSDAGGGILIGLSHDVRVDHNRATNNNRGYGIVNSSGVRMDHNQADANTAGIQSVSFPFLDVKINENNRIDHNDIFFNDYGILLVGADKNQVDHNFVDLNDQLGIVVTNLCAANELSEPECAALDVDPYSDDNIIIKNTALNNGGSAPGADLVWDTTGTGNCWKDNTYDSEPLVPLPTCP